MTHRWRLVEDLYHRARQLSAAEQAAFLDDACRGDTDLRSELESLLAEDCDVSSFMGSPAIQEAARELAAADLLAEGQRVGSFTILSLAGRGSMGDVYRARDTTLGRDVAVKLLPISLAFDPARLARFDREARLLAALSHPNIATIHGVEALDGRTVLVLEFVDGITLAERLQKGALRIKDALRLAVQIADALESAHEHGVVHRDLKPANVKITAERRVKVLDFGLAKALGQHERWPEPDNAASGPVRPTTETQSGVLLGTVTYMSPEQARGEPVDQRADIWAFGCVLYEMLAGRPPFAGTTVDETLANILEKQPDFARLSPDTPPPVARLIRRCLEKDPHERLRHLGDARIEIRDVLATLTDEPTAAHVARRRWPLWLSGGSLAAALIAALTLGWFAPATPRPVVRSMMHTQAQPPVPLNMSSSDVAVSPEGTHVVYSGRDGLLVRRLDRLDATPLVEGVPLAQNPFFSPDGAWVGFVSPLGWQKVPVSGGSVVPLWPTQGNSRGATWADDTILFAYQDSGLWQGSGAGGAPIQLTTPDRERGEIGHSYPDLLPGGRGILFTIERRGATDAMEIAVLDRRSGQTSILIAGGSSPKYLSTGHIVYGSNGTLRAVPFDVDRLEVIGSPVTVVEGVASKPTGAVDFDVTNDAALVYVTGGEVPHPKRVLVWVDRQERETPISAPPRAYLYPRISPDGTHAALDVRDEQNDIYIWSFVDETFTRLTFDPGLDRTPVWSPDGRRIAYSSEREGIGAANVFWRPWDGSGLIEPLTTTTNVLFPTAFSPDESLLVLSEATQTTGWDMRVVGLDGTGHDGAAAQATFHGLNGDVSPDGRWLAYESHESGAPQVYVRPLHPAPGTAPRQVSEGGGSRPVWSHDGQELFYLVEPGRLMAVPVSLNESTTTLKHGRAQRLFDGPYVTDNALRTYDVSPDGQRFLMIKAAPEPADAPTPAVVLVQSWGEELRRLVPVD